MNELNFEQIGKKLKSIRISQGLTQEYVANMVNVNTSHISNIENNRVKISLSTLVKICNVLNITVDYILSNEYNSDNSALDNEILKELKKCNEKQKEQFLQMIKIFQI